jgi:predicted Zn finger-like uncharacterized protein
MFRVVPDQLRISEGWVRCGHCSEVFDAHGHLQTRNLARQQPEITPAASLPVLAEASASTGAPSAGAEQSEVLSSGASLVPVESDEVSALQYKPERADVGRQAADNAPEVTRESPASSVLPLASPDPAELLAGHPQVPADVPAASEAKTELDLRTYHDAAHADEIPTLPESLLDEDVSFVLQARRKAFWRRPLIRFSLSALAVVLLCCLALQVALYERDQLAVLEPQVKPWLIRLCAQLDCRVAVPRQIESVVIDSSTFTKVRSDVFRLSFTVRNTAGVEVATPAVEVTLMDTQEQPVLRRVLTPSEIGAGPVLSLKGEWSAVLNMGVEPTGGGRVSGYRLLAFYP